MEKFFYEINKYKKRKIEKEVIYQNILKNNEILINKKVDVKSFIENKIECSKLLGCPGGGKTTAIINKIIHHFENKDMTISNNFLVLTFSKYSQQDFLEKGKQKKKVFNNINVRTIHSLSGSIVTKLMKMGSSSLETVVKKASDIVIKCKKSDLLGIRSLAKLKVIFVDEAQDLTQLYYDFIINLSDKLGCALILVGDPNQNIYQFNNCSDQYLMCYKAPMYVLTTNYRSTKNIVKFINYLRPWKKIIPDMVSNSKIDGKKPEVYTDSVQNIMENIVHEINNYDGNLSDIAIIGPVKKSKPMNNTYINIGLSLVVNKLEEENIKYTQYYNFESDNYTYTKGSIKRIDGHVNIMTCHTSKGLEFEKILLINFHNNTHGRKPTESAYKDFGYLWYVGVSRAKSELKMYSDELKLIYQNLFLCPKDTYMTNIPPLKKKVDYASDEPELFFPITEIIKDKKIFDDKTFAFFEKSFEISKKTKSIFQVNGDLSNFSKYSAFCGIFFESVFMYYCEKNKQQYIKLIQKRIDYFDKLVEVPNKYYKCISSLNLNLFEVITMNDIYKYRNSSNLWSEFYEYLLGKRFDSLNSEFAFYMKNDVQNTDFEKIKKMMKQLIKYDCSENESMILLVEICLFEYQYNNEIKFLSEEKNKFPIISFLKSSKPWLKCIKKYSQSVNKNMFFQIQNKHPYLNIIGVSDIVDNNNNITEIKFVNEITLKHILQVMLYYNNIHYDWTNSNKLKFTILNLKNGKKMIYTVTPLISNYTMNKKLRKILNTKFNNPIIFYDLETNSESIMNILDGDIIERHCQDYLTGWVISKGLIKPYGRVYPHIEKLTGITNKMIKKKSDKNINKFKKEIRNFINNSIDPIFVAHNGNAFDHKILQEKRILADKYKLLDSRIFMRMETPIDIKSLRLSEIYECVIGFKPVVAHRAKADVIMMVDICRKLNINKKYLFDLLKIPDNDDMIRTHDNYKNKYENLIKQISSKIMENRILNKYSNRKFEKIKEKIDNMLQYNKYIF